MPSYLPKTKKSDDPSMKSTFTSGISLPWLDLSEINVKDGKKPKKKFEKYVKKLPC